MAAPASFLPGLSPVRGKPVRVAFDGGRLTSDAGVLVPAEIERRLGLAGRLTRCLADPRSPERMRRTLAEPIRFRVPLIAAGHPDANDCDAPRIDPASKMAVGRLPGTGANLCSQPTMCRRENLPGSIALERMMAAMLELFLRQLRAGARRPTACPLPRLPRQAVLPADPGGRGDHGQARRGDPAPGQAPPRGPRGRASCATSWVPFADAGRGSTSWSAATATTAGRRR